MKKILFLCLLIPKLTQPVINNLDLHQNNHLTILALPLISGIILNTQLYYWDKITESENAFSSGLFLACIDALKSGNHNLTTVALKTFANSCGLYLIDSMHKLSRSKNSNKNRYDEDDYEDDLIKVNKRIDSMLSYAGVYADSTVGAFTKYLIFFELTKEVLSKINSLAF